MRKSLCLRKCLKIDELEISQQRCQEKLFQKVQITSLKAKECGEGKVGFKNSSVIGADRKGERRQELIELQILGELSFLSVSCGLLSLF